MRRLKASINPAEQERLETALSLRAPVKVRFKDRLTGREMGRAITDGGQRTITIELGSQLYEYAKLRDLRNELGITILHEFRHFHQWDNWDSAVILADQLLPYAMRRTEKDAEEWARGHFAQWGDLLSLKVQHFNTGLSKLGRVERSVRSGR